MSFSSKIVPRGLQGFYLEALRSLAVCKLCTSVLHSCRASQSGGFKHDLAFQMICRSAGASRAAGEPRLGFSPLHWIGFHVLAAQSILLLASEWMYETPPGLVGSFPNAFTLSGSSEIFFQTKVFITLKNTIHSAVTLHLLINSFTYKFIK